MTRRWLAAHRKPQSPAQRQRRIPSPRCAGKTPRVCQSRIAQQARAILPGAASLVGQATHPVRDRSVSQVAAGPRLTYRRTTLEYRETQHILCQPRATCSPMTLFDMSRMSATSMSSFHFHDWVRVKETGEQGKWLAGHRMWALLTRKRGPQARLRGAASTPTMESCARPAQNNPAKLKASTAKRQQQSANKVGFPPCGAQCCLWHFC